MAANRLLALVLAVVIGLGLYLGLTRTRLGTAVRAVAVDPVAAQLVAIDVRTASALAFALGGALVAAAGVLVSMFLTFNANLGVVFTLKALIVVIMGGVGNLLGGADRRADPGPGRELRRHLRRSRPDAGRHLRHLPDRAAGAAAGPARQGQPVTAQDALRASGARRRHRRASPACRCCWATIGLSLAINIVSYTVLATAWSLFSGPTRYVSLATVAFFGIGAYTVAVFAETLRLAAGAADRGSASASLVAGIVGLSTLRLSGVYFVIFTFGLAELVRQLVTWFEVNKTRTLGRYVFIDITAAQIYWQLLALAVLVFAAGFLIGRSRLGLALRVIGDDETVARHSGIDTTRAKVALFVLSTVFMTLDRRDHGAALDLHRSRHRLQSGDLLHGADHGAAGRRASALRAGAGRGAAGAAVRVPAGALPQPLQHPGRRWSSS